MLPQHFSREHRGQRQHALAAVAQIAHLIQHLATTQEGGVGFLWDTPVRAPLHTPALHMMGPSVVINTPKRGSGAHRTTHIWQNLLPRVDLDEAYSNIRNHPHTVNDILDRAGLQLWRMPTRDTPASIHSPTRALSRFGTRPTPPPDRGLALRQHQVSSWRMEP